jgi:hypothetical protein
MRETETKLTTPTRRSAIGFSLAAFAAGLTVPAIANAAEPDAELIAFAATLRENNAKIRALQAMKAYHPDETYVPLDKCRHGAIAESCDLTATTMAGLRAKAAMILDEIDLTQSVDDLDNMEYLNYSLARDLIGLAGSAVA